MASYSWINTRNGYRTCAGLQDVPAISVSYRCDQCFVCHYAVSHLSNVRAELYRYCQRYDSRLGKSGRRCYADGDAAHLHSCPEFGVNEFLGWRLAMIVPGIALFIMGFVYYFFTQDAPDGDYKELRERGELEPAEGKGMESFMLAIKDYRVWALFFIYAACFGVELTINNVAALYYHDQFQLDVKTAGLIAGLFGLMNIFARTVGGFLSDFFAKKMGLRGRVLFLFAVLLGEGFMLIVFSQMAVLILAVGTMIVFSLFVQMSEGATFGIVPFINKKALGAVAGIVGAGGNAGAVAAGFLFRAENITTQQALLFLGGMVVVTSFATVLVRFSPAVQDAERKAFEAALAEKHRLKAEAGNVPA